MYTIEPQAYKIGTSKVTAMTHSRDKSSQRRSPRKWREFSKRRTRNRWTKIASIWKFKFDKNQKISTRADGEWMGRIQADDGLRSVEIVELEHGHLLDGGINKLILAYCIIWKVYCVKKAWSSEHTADFVGIMIQKNCTQNYGTVNIK